MTSVATRPGSTTMILLNYSVGPCADSVELKLTVPESEYCSTVEALGEGPIDAPLRQVFFFDTPELALIRRPAEGRYCATNDHRGRPG